MRALSLTQPWATLITIGAKRCETRSWGNAHRGFVAIHASKRFPAEAKEMVRAEHFWPALLAWYRARHPAAPEPHWTAVALALPTAALVGSARVADAYRMQHEADRLPDSPAERAFGWYGPGRWVWQLERPIEIARPLPCIGSLGLWAVPPAIARTLEERIVEARYPGLVAGHIPLQHEPGDTLLQPQASP